MKNRNKKSQNNIYKKAKYYFDIWLSKGTLSTIIFLFVVTGIFVLIIGVLAKVIRGRDASLGKSIWDTMNHVLILECFPETVAAFFICF